MLHGIRIQDGEVKWYKNRYVRTNMVSDKLGEPRVGGPRRSPTDIVNTNIQPFAGKLWMLVESGPTPMLMTADLDTIAYDDFNGTLNGAFAAHPHPDPLTGEWHAITYEVTDPASGRYVVISPEGKRVRSVQLPMTDGPMLHDFALTQSYVIILDLPCVWNEEYEKKGHLFPYFWKEGRPARVGLLPRDGSAEDIIWIERSPCAVFHVANAFDEDGLVKLDVVEHQKAFDEVRVGVEESIPLLVRWEIDPEKKSIEVKPLVTGYSLEFPKIDDRLFTLKHRYIYAPAVGSNDGAFVRYDTEKGEETAYVLGKGRIACSEAIFVPRNEQAGENDGWVLGLTYDFNTDSSELLIMDAQNFGADPVAVIHLPQRVPMGFHGCWCPMSALDPH